jgi:hypothetical protein
MFLLPTHTLFAIAAAVGLDRILRSDSRWRGIVLRAVAVSITLTPILYGVTPPILERTGISIRPGRSFPYRDENRYWITPWKFNEESANRFAKAAFDVAGPNADILPGGMATPPLQVLQRGTGARPDVRVLDWSTPVVPADAGRDELRTYLAERPVYAAATEPLLIPGGWVTHVKTHSVFPLVKVESLD